MWHLECLSTFQYAALPSHSANIRSGKTLAPSIGITTLVWVFVFYNKTGMLCRCRVRSPRPYHDHLFLIDHDRTWC